MTTSRVVFIVNPRSANGATLRRFEKLRAHATRMLPASDVQLTTEPHHATALSRAAVRAGARAVVAVGGDGTLNEVVNGFFDEEGARIASDTALGVVTSGTGGDFRRTFRRGTDPLADLARIARHERRTVDVGRVRFINHAGAPETRFFLNIASFGLSGAVDQIVNRSSKALGATASFLIASVRAMIGHRAQRVRLRLDDAAPFEEDIALFTAANGQYFGGGMWIAPDARPDDGVLTTVRVRGGGLPFWIGNTLRVYAGTHVKSAAVGVASARVVVAEPVCREPVLLDLDGEQPGMLPATFDIVPATLSLLV